LVNASTENPGLGRIHPLKKQSETYPPGLLSLRCNLISQSNLYHSDKENLASAKPSGDSARLSCPRYTFAHSQTIYGSLVETRGPYLRSYMNSL